jgi:hypothetical protein
MSKRPSHHLWAVRKTDDGKGFWPRIGAGTSSSAEPKSASTTIPERSATFRTRACTH